MTNLRRVAARRDRRRRTGLVALAPGVAIVLVLLVAGPGWAASPGSGSVGPGDPSSHWSGKSYVAGATASPAACDAGGDTLCDHFALSVGVSSSYWDTHTGGIRVSISWGDSADNFDLYVYSGGDLAGSSTSGSSSSEGVSISNAAGSYSVVVVPKLVTDSGYGGSVSFSSQDKPKPSPTGGSGGGGHGGSGGGAGTGGGGGGSGGGGGATTGSGSGGTGTTGSVPGSSPVVQPGGPLPFGLPKGPIFDYNGPYFFKPPFSVGGSPGHAVQPPQPGVAGSGAAGGGRAVQPPGPAAQPADQPEPNARRPVRIRTVGGSPDRSLTGLFWLLAPLGLIFAAAVGSALFERDDRQTVAAARETSGRQTRGSLAPPPGAFVTLGFATRRAVGALARGIRRLGRRG